MIRGGRAPLCLAICVSIFSKMPRPLSFILLLCAIDSVFGVYRDQAGLHETVRTFVGPPIAAAASGTKGLVVVTRAGAISGLNTRTGELSWRSVLSYGAFYTRRKTAPLSLLLRSTRTTHSPSPLSHLPPLPPQAIPSCPPPFQSQPLWWPL